MKYTFESLKNYALWYYFKYFPSSKKLNSKLMEKLPDEEICKKVMKNIGHLINEKQVIGDKIRLYLLRNKNLNYIRSKLIVAGFDKYLVQEILENDFLEDGESLLNKKSLYIKIENYKNAGKSIQYIKQKLIERNEDRKIIEEIIADVFIEGESDNIIREIEKLKNKYESQKIIQKLIAKGFNYNEIKKYV